LVVELIAQRNATLQAAYADGTKRNMATHWEVYLEFCELYQNSRMQANIESLSLFIQYVSNRVKSPGAVQNYISGIKTMHIINELDISIFDDFCIKMMIRGVKVSKKHTPKKAALITPDILEKFYDSFDHTVANECTYWALFVLAFFLLARKSNLVPDTIATFDSNKQLVRGDIHIRDDYLEVTLKWSKTNQTGHKEVYPLLKNEGSKLCPVAAFKKMVSFYPAKEGSPAFLLKRYGRVSSVTYRNYQDKLKSCVLALGLDPTLYTSHIFRRVGATYAFQCGVPAAQIKRLGDGRVILILNISIVP